MHDGDLRYYTNAVVGGGNIRVSGSSQPNSFTVSESFSGSASYYTFSATGDELLSTGGALGGNTLGFTPSVVILDEGLLANGGSKTSSTTISLAGTNLPASLIVTVTPTGTAQVPAGTFQNCRQVNVDIAVTVPGQGRQQVQATAYVLAPGVGIVRIALLDTNLQVSGWAELAGGSVGGANTVDLAGQSGKVPPGISAQPHSQTTPQARKASFSVAATGSDLSYRWSKNGVPLSNDGRITGADSPTLSLKTVLKTDAGAYSVLISNSLCTVSSASAVLSIAAAGSYYGLFSESGQMRFGSAGYINLVTTDRGTYSGKLQLAGKNYPLKGSFDATGMATQSVSRPGMNPLQVQLQVISGSDRLVGSISDGVWTAPVLGRMAVFKTNPCPYAGTYTVVLPGSQNPSMPQGYGFGAVTINSAGQLRFSGSLADGVPVTQSTIISSDGQWPLFVSLYGGQGILLGWISFAQQAGSDLNGTLEWEKPALSYVKYYPRGFTNQVSLTGSAYAPPALGVRVVGWSTGTAQFSGGDLAQVLANSVTLGIDNRMINSSNKLTLTVANPSGLFKGSFVAPGSTKPLPVQGAIFQKLNKGYGYFLGQTGSGSVLIIGN